MTETAVVTASEVKLDPDFTVLRELFKEYLGLKSEKILNLSEIKSVEEMILLVLSRKNENWVNEFLWLSGFSNRNLVKLILSSGKIRTVNSLQIVEEISCCLDLFRAFDEGNTRVSGGVL